MVLLRSADIMHMSRDAAYHAMALQPPQPLVSLQLKVTLLGVRPAVWRRIVVPNSVVLPELHAVLQKAFGWSDSHLHAFKQGRRSFQPFNPDFDLGRDPGRVSDEAGVVLGELLRAKGDELDYQYDFGGFLGACDRRRGSARGRGRRPRPLPRWRPFGSAGGLRRGVGV